MGAAWLPLRIGLNMLLLEIVEIGEHLLAGVYLGLLLAGQDAAAAGGQGLHFKLAGPDFDGGDPAHLLGEIGHQALVV